MASDLLTQGLELMLVGMGTVFVFLTALVFATLTMSRLVTRYLPGDQTASDSTAASPEEVAAITAAIEQHRRHRR